MELAIDKVSAWHGSERTRSLVLDEVSLGIPAASLTAVLGPSGSGKTTLLRVVAGLHRQASGQVRLGERRLDHLPPERRGVGLVPQDSALFPHLTVAENVDFGLPRSQRRGRRTADMLGLLGLMPYAKRLPHQLSGGQAQRVAVARALAPAPALVLLDEPFSALDASLRVEVRAQVALALRETGTTALLVTHDQSEALSLASWLVVLSSGRVRQAGSPQEVYAEPADVWTGCFLGDANVLAAESDGQSAATSIGTVHHQRTTAGPVTVLVRPEQVELDGGEGVIGTVSAAQFFGHDVMAQVRLATGESVLARVSADRAPSVGAQTRVRAVATVRAFAPPT